MLGDEEAAVIADLQKFLKASEWESFFDPAQLESGWRLYADEKVKLQVLADEGRDVLLGVIITEHDGGFTPLQVKAKQRRDWSLSADCKCGASKCEHFAAMCYQIQGGRKARDEQVIQLAQEMKRGAVRVTPNPQDALPLEFERWMRLQDELHQPTVPAPSRTGSSTHLLHYAFHCQSLSRRGGIAAFAIKTAPNKAKPIQLKFSYANLKQAAKGELPKYIPAADRELIFQMLTLPGVSSRGGQFEFAPTGRFWGQILSELLAPDSSRRFVWGEEHTPLRIDGSRRVKTGWLVGESGDQRSRLSFEDTGEPAYIIPCDPAFYVDPVLGTIGPLGNLETAAELSHWLRAPVLPPVFAPAVRRRWTGSARAASLPTELETEKMPPTRPRGRLFLRKANVVPPYYYGYGYRFKNEEHVDASDLNLASVQINYDGVVVEPGGQVNQITRFSNGKVRILDRDKRAENELFARMDKTGAIPVATLPGIYTIRPEFQHSYTFSGTKSRGVYATTGKKSAAREEWFKFISEEVPKLKAEGWTVEVDPSFEFAIIQPDAWYADISEGAGIDFFKFDYGFEIAGRRVSMLSALIEFVSLRLLNGNLDEFLNAAEHETITIFLARENAAVPLPKRKLGEMAAVLLELFSLPGAQAGEVHRLQATQLVNIDSIFTNETVQRLRRLSKQMADFQGIQAVDPPASLQASLRAYQQQGLNWLQFLRAYELNGVLADDMGLGKTVQTLASLLIEKESGRLDRPSLIVAPTSVLSNWVREAAKFAPTLRVLLLHGPQRKEHFDLIPEHDLVVTSFPLLSRDGDILREYEYHDVILDEAQLIKNPKSNMARAACQLKSRHRLCLTGTPMENHLGELWSLFHFLMPGLLGDLDVFNRVFRRPIETVGDRSRREVLVKRVAPLILRRTKGQVLHDLPPRTEILREVPLDKKQAELYEVVRAAMDKKVRDAVKEKGVARSHIIVLDALLKLRQICCHPKLLKSESARKCETSAKLESLMELLGSLVEEGRFTLVFSQFTSMLALIEAELDAAKIPYVILTGETRDRKTVIDRFQGGEVPIFLISLKAGGTGLNLTRADTVVHYDPWWNPAVEEQATGRAHRIGQENPVFVYKLIAEGTIEERIQELQEKKAEIARAILDGGGEESGEGGLTLDKSDLEHLLSPVTAV